MTSKERAELRGIASTMDTMLQIGKDGITDAVIKSVNDLFNTHEIIKCKVLENSLLSAREACNEISSCVGAEQIQVIGSKFVLYKKNKKLENKKTENKNKLKLEKKRPENKNKLRAETKK